ncbi:MAG: vacuolar import and degradation protein [Benniella sp.]|nr:MAG: vacuolar import and degradation protein [Benniella sp.]
MPVYKLARPSTDTPSGIAPMQWPCTCPISGEEGSSESTEALDQQDPQDQKQALSRTQSHIQPPHQPGERQHLSTCALYKNVDSKLVQTTKKRELEIIQEQQRKRRKDPFEPCRTLPSGTFHLYAGSQFRGEQKSGDQSYVVQVEIKQVDLNNSFLCGYLHINGLTSLYQKLTTYFEAEIIGPKHQFKTQKWGVNENIDEEHWTKFDQFACLANSVFYDSDDEDSDEDDDEDGSPCPHHQHYDPLTYHHQNEDVVFMRWKEHFLVPDHRIQDIQGASFAGFYYICYNKTTGRIDGYYYYQSSAKYQQLVLQHVDDRSFGSFEFR